jgi:hypothetical protein
MESQACNQLDDLHRNDWVTRPGAGIFWWCLPICIGFVANLFALPTRSLALIWVVLFVWMGTGCILNARRCHRLHCYISGPAFLLGAVALGLLAAGLLPIGSRAFSSVVGITLLAALLSFVPEIWKKYL